MTSWMWMLGQALAGCDASGIEAVVDAVSQVRAEHHPMMAATGFAQACTTPAGLVSAARQLPSVPPDLRPMIDMKAATEAPLAWNAVCDGGLRVLSDMVALPVEQKREHLWTGCGLKARGWFTREEWRGADGTIVLALAGAQAAADAGISAAHVRVLARALAGIGDAAPIEDPLMDPFVELQLDLPQPRSSRDQGSSGGRGGGGAGGGALAPSPADDAPAGFRQRVAPTWSPRARRKGGSCTVQVFVTRSGDLRDLEFLACDSALEGDVRAAVEASELRPRSKDGATAAGRFRATYDVD